MPKIKICGLFREQDIEFANEARPDFIGFVFAEKSKRFVEPSFAENLRKKLASGIVPVGVFVNAKIDSIVSLQKNGIIDMVQLHGNESDEYIEELKAKCNAKVIRALNLNNSQLSTLNSPLSDYILLDSQVPGSGKSFDWECLRGIDLSGNVFLAGGINLQNIKEALKLNPFAVDISSGAETDGVKNRDKMLKLVSHFLYF
ncbi:MAG: phosphoribosylanthranilate isomerase [Fibromonadales bacterium]|nr:phosphoribosylanthranilate isomerase [Fibromonadales bacterium]